MKTKRSPNTPSPELTKALGDIADLVESRSDPAPADRSLLPLNGSVHFGRPQGDSCDYISIEITDDTSRIQFIEARIKYADFTHAITGHGGQPITFETRGLNLIGTRHEYKTEIVPFDCYAYRGDTAAQTKALAPFEVDGWEGRRDDLTNGHCSHERGFQRVHFSRHVDPKTGKPVIPS